MIGRKKEIEKISRLLASGRSEFLAVTGRRRVGKTFLIDSLLREHYCFSMTGIQHGSLTAQLVNFGVKLSEYEGSASPKMPENWQMAFLQLKNHLKTLGKDKKRVIFIDELPWVNTPKSNFVQMLAHFWNDYLSKEPNFLLVICGSATSWIAKRIINDPGGLHNRITENIHLSAFTLAETNAFFKNKGFDLTAQELTKIYMTFGGVPFYLDNLRKGENFSVGIERICFSPSGLLHNEYHNLFKALFNNADMHETIVEVLATSPMGLSRAEILQKIGLERATGSFHRAVEELMVSDFVAETTPFEKQKRGAVYRLNDEFCIFYHRFLKPNKKYVAGIWQQLAESQAYKIWSGYAFEMLCHKHIEGIKKALGIASVYTKIYSLKVPGTADTDGFQLDLLIDRKDNCINLCEIKFHAGQFSISKAYSESLLMQKQRFHDLTRTKKQVFLTFISNHGLAPNAYSRSVVDSEVRLEDLLEG